MQRRTSMYMGVVAAIVGLVSVLLPASSAAALGNNRTVQRSCGSNYISSGFDGTDYWAQTVRASGNCSGRFSLNFEMSDGRWMTRTYYTSHSAYRAISPSFGKVSHGLHWGCDNCNVTKS
ncbi:hypothetical protein ACH4SP_05070 [Streptomyces sp. NPDC021093]|uniref:hypothetical protein n=1 Tax=Streptomyces sp. NPDC021093 TaxID=3365112 RepID=UPI0037BBA402